MGRKLRLADGSPLGDELGFDSEPLLGLKTGFGDGSLLGDTVGAILG